jgi:hypothetical protein
VQFSSLASAVAFNMDWFTATTEVGAVLCRQSLTKVTYNAWAAGFKTCTTFTELNANMKDRAQDGTNMERAKSLCEVGAKFVEVPAPLLEAFHPAHPLAPDVTRKQRTKLAPPLPYGLMTHVDPALEQQVFDLAQRQRKLNVHHHYEADHLG